MDRLTFSLAISTMLCLAACSITEKAHQDKGTEANTATPSEGVAHFLAAPNSGANVNWKGYCVQKTGVEVDMQLVADGHYTVSSVPASSFTTESGVYKASGDAISFFDSMGMIQQMSCGVEANVSNGMWTVAKGLSCALDRSSKLSFFGDCSLIKFARIEDIKAPKADPAPAPAPKPTDTTIKVDAGTITVDKPAKAVLGSVDLSLTGTCDKDNVTPAAVSLNKAGGFSVTASGHTLAGQYFKTDVEGAYKAFVNTSGDQPVDGNSDMTCSGPSSANGHNTYKCIVTNKSFILFTDCSALTLAAP